MECVFWIGRFEKSADDEDPRPVIGPSAREFGNSTNLFHAHLASYLGSSYIIHKRTPGLFPTAACGVGKQKGIKVGV